MGPDCPTLIVPWKAHRKFHVRLEDGQHGPEMGNMARRGLPVTLKSPPCRNSMVHSAKIQTGEPFLSAAAEPQGYWGNPTQIPPLGA